MNILFDIEDYKIFYFDDLIGEYFLCRSLELFLNGELSILGEYDSIVESPEVWDRDYWSVIGNKITNNLVWRMIMNDTTN